MSDSWEYKYVTQTFDSSDNEGLALSDIKFPSDGGGNAVGIAKNSPKLLKEINKTIKRLQESGELDQYIIDANNLAAKNS